MVGPGDGGLGRRLRTALGGSAVVHVVALLSWAAVYEPATAVPERRCGLHALIEPPPEAGLDPADEAPDEVSDPAAPRRPRRRERR